MASLAGVTPRLFYNDYCAGEVSNGRLCEYLGARGLGSHQHIGGVMIFTLDIELSEWCRWIAMDEDGAWWEYSDKPEMSGRVWVNSKKYGRLFSDPNPTEDWRESLYEITWE